MEDFQKQLDDLKDEVAEIRWTVGPKIEIPEIMFYVFIGISVGVSLASLGKWYFDTNIYPKIQEQVRAENEK